MKQKLSVEKVDEDSFVWPWIGIIVNVPIEFEYCLYVGLSGSKFRDQLMIRGFNPTRIRPLWNYKGHSGIVLVEFQEDWFGFSNAMSFEKSYQSIHRGKKNWLLKFGQKTGMYAWVARADDYNANNVIGEILRGIGILSTVVEVLEEAAHKPKLVVAEVERMGQESDETQERLWSNLPDNLLCEIFSRLFPRDRAVFMCISKSWNSIDAITNQKFELPHDLECSYPSLLFSNDRIFHPIYEDCEYVWTPDFISGIFLSGQSYGIFHQMDFLVDGSLIRSAKDGWLLMTLQRPGIFFFNPFTDELVELPNLDEFEYVMSTCFSSPPTSTDWFVSAVVISRPECDNIAILTIKHGEKSWGYQEISLEGQSFECSYCNHVVVEGIYYLLGEDGKLLIHNPLTLKSNFHKAPESIFQISEEYLLVDDGKLLAIFVGCEGSSVRVCEWNCSKMKWETVDSLGDEKMIFVSHPMSLCVRVSTRKRIGNRIYFPRLVGSHCLYYSLTTKSLHTSTFVMDTSYENFVGSKEYQCSTWIITPRNSI